MKRTKAKRERRKPLVCLHCQAVMISMRRAEPISSSTKSHHVWYICPRRKKEGGCGYTRLVQVSPKNKYSPRTVFSVKFKKLK